MLDGRSLAAGVARSFRRSGVYTIPLQPGSIAEMLEPSLAGESSTRVVSYGWLLRLRPLRPGRHELTFSTDELQAGPQEISFEIMVRRAATRLSTIQTASWGGA